MWANHVIRQQNILQTLECHMLSDRELNDLGIGRSEIRNAIYGKDVN